MKFLEITTGGGRLLRFSVFILLIFSFFLISSASGFTPQSFAPKVDYAVGTSPSSVFASDLDRDGDLDLVVIGWGSDKISVLMNNGKGTFAAKVEYPAADGPFEVFAADLDGDTFPDLAVANAGPNADFLNNTISILINNGDGTFADTVNYSTGTGPFSIVAENLVGDPALDLIVLKRFADTLSVLTNNGNGTFCCQVDYPTEPGTHKIFASDLDRDGDKDVAVTNLGELPNLGGTTVSVFMNNGDGTFADRVNYTTRNSPAWVFAANLDGDTFPDLAVTNNGPSGVGMGDSTVSVLKNNGDGTFADTVNYKAGYRPGPIAVADLDGDGHLDLAVAYGGTALNSTVSILKNNGDGTFAAKVDYTYSTTANLPHSLIAGDWDGDGDLDLAAVGRTNSNTVSVLINLLINQTPVLDPLTPETLYENDSTKFRVHFTDPDIYQASITSPTVLNNDSLIDSGNTAGAYSFKPDNSQAGNYNIVFIASDGILADTDSVAITVLDCVAKPGDANASGTTPNLTDIIYLVGYVFKGGPPPFPLCRGDANASGSSPNLTDIIYLVSYVFKGGPKPKPSGACCIPL